MPRIGKANALSHLDPVNPFSKTHGDQKDEERHVGDLGNFKTDSQGNSKASITDKHIELIGQNSVLGVSFLSKRTSVG